MRAKPDMAPVGKVHEMARLGMVVAESHRRYHHEMETLAKETAESKISSTSRQSFETLDKFALMR